MNITLSINISQDWILNKLSGFGHGQETSSSLETTAEEKRELLNKVSELHHRTKCSGPGCTSCRHGRVDRGRPNPFRRYLAAPDLPLLHPSSNDQSTPPYSSLFNCLPSPKPISKATLSQLLYNSLALSAWKTTGSETWSLRVNPSNGNLHPTEAYIISPAIDSLSQHPFVAHYAPKEHVLEFRARIPSGFFTGCFPEGSFLIGFLSIFWREASVYPYSAFSHCNQDVGHAIGAVTMAAAGLGWDVRVLDGFGYEELEELMGLKIFPEFNIPPGTVREINPRKIMPEMEFEHPDCVLLVFPKGGEEIEVDYEKLRLALSKFSDLEWKGKPDTPSEWHVPSDMVYIIAEAVKKPLTMSNELVPVPFRSSGMISESCYKGFNLSQVVRNRRSAIRMDGFTTMERETFYQILLHCLPSGCGESGYKQGKQLALPFRALPWDCEVHAVLSVHRIVGVRNGLYFLVRNERYLEELRTAMRSDFKWMKPDGCPDDLPLYELGQGDLVAPSPLKLLSSHQKIIRDGCFSLGMVARFEPTLLEAGAWMYPRLFWEAGVLGQVLYLEAHAVGISATGLGCFLNDHVNNVLGLRGSKFESLYHFTVGGAVLDKLIMNLPVYPGPSIDA